MTRRLMSIAALAAVVTLTIGSVNEAEARRCRRSGNQGCCQTSNYGNRGYGYGQQNYQYGSGGCCQPTGWVAPSNCCQPSTGWVAASTCCHATLMCCSVQAADCCPAYLPGNQPTPPHAEPTTGPSQSVPDADVEVNALR